MFKYNNKLLFDELGFLYNNSLITYESNILYDEIDFLYGGFIEPTEEKVSNFVPTFTGPPRDSHGPSRASVLMWNKRNQQEEELLSLLGYL
jgi:hypothetical protein